MVVAGGASSPRGRELAAVPLPQVLQMGLQGGPPRLRISYSCQTEEERAALTQLMGRFAAPHHLAAQLHPQRCKERQMWYLASCQDTSFFLKSKAHITGCSQLGPSVCNNTAVGTEDALFKRGQGGEGDIGGKQSFFSKHCPTWTRSLPTPPYC